MKRYENKYLEILHKFYSNKDSRLAILNMLNDLCEHCQIDEAGVILYSDISEKYFKIQEYNKENGLVDHTNELDMNINDFLNLLNEPKYNDRETFINLCNDEGYFYTDDYVAYKDKLSQVGYKCKNENTLKEVYMFLGCASKELFTYYVFEIHNEEKLSEEKKYFLTLICKVIREKLEISVLVKKHENNELIRELILKNEKMPIIVVDEKLSILYYNKSTVEMLGNVKIGDNFCEIISPENKCKNCDYLKEDIVSVNNQQWVRKIIPFQLLNGKDAYVIYCKNSTDYIEQVNAVDKLTGALMKRGFEEYYTSFIQRNDDNYALCTLDIDKFKYINTMFGYKTGDEVLKKVADEISKFIDSQENFCRMGEDKFSILMHYEDDVSLHLKLRELSNKFNEMRDKYFPDIKLTIVGGVTLVDKEKDLNILIDQSTTARKSGKGSLKNKFNYYNKEIDLKLQKDIEIEERIPQAIANDEFEAFLQPKFNLETRKISGAEALVRWITPKGMIFPDQFIPLFEKNGFIVTLDFIIYDKVMKYIRKCLDRGLKVYTISVNVSRNHIKDGKFLSKFMELINKYNVPVEYLELEVTESVFVEDRKELKSFIDGIKKEGLKVSIDDFGTAYSSLQTLTDINVDVLKIDKGFLDNIEYSKKNILTDSINKDEILIKNIINLAKELEFKVICEGVETDEQIRFLKSVGCELGQGYVFAKPMPISDYDEKYIN